MAIKEIKVIKKVNKLFLVGLYLSLLILTFGGLYWLNQKGKEIAKRPQDPNNGQIQLVDKNNNFVTGENGTDETAPREPGESRETQKTPTADTIKINDFGAVGALNHQYLQSEPFSKLVVEIDQVDTISPNQSSVDSLIATLKEYADKPEGISRTGDNTFQALKTSYSVQDLISVAKANRSNYSQGSTVTLYVLYVNGEFGDNPNALGVALNSSMFVIFKDKINSATTAVVVTSEIERSVLIHELGHLWGLVNLSYRSSFEHEDKNYPNHSSNRDSVTYWAVEDISVANLLRGGPPYRFDSADQDDIAKIKTGVY